MQNIPHIHQMWEIFHIILLVPQNIVMNSNNVILGQNQITTYNL